MKLDLDPSLQRVIATGILLFLEVLLGNIIVQLQTGNYPSPIQALTILCVSALSIVTYLLTFLRKEEEKETEDSG